MSPPAETCGQRARSPAAVLVGLRGLGPGREPGRAWVCTGPGKEAGVCFAEAGDGGTARGECAGDWAVRGSEVRPNSPKPRSSRGEMAVCVERLRCGRLLTGEKVRGGLDRPGSSGG